MLESAMDKTTPSIPQLSKEQLREILGPKTRTLVGEEYDQAMLVMAFIEPFDESNNQQWFTEKYKIGESIYHVHYIHGDPMIEVEEDY